MPDRTIEQKKQELHTHVLRALEAAKIARLVIKDSGADSKLSDALSRGLNVGPLVLH